MGAIAGVQPSLAALPSSVVICYFTLRLSPLFKLSAAGQEKTSTGLKKSDLMKSKSGRVVTKKQHAKGKALFQKYAQRWLDAVMKARKELGIKGFCAIGGKNAQGKALYAKAKAFYAEA